MLFQDVREVGGDVSIFESGVTEAVDQRVQQAVRVGQNHQAVVHLNHHVLGGLVHLQPLVQKHPPGRGARQEAEGEDHHHRQDHEHRPPQLGPLPHRLPLQPTDDAGGAVDQDDERDDDLDEEDDLQDKRSDGSLTGVAPSEETAMGGRPAVLCLR